MAFTYTITNVSNNITVTPGGDNLTITKTTSSVSISPNATIIQTKNTADTYKGQWASGTSYQRGDTVTYGNILYLAIANVTSGTNPQNDTTNWTQYVVASSTSTFVRLTATNAIVAKAQAVFAFEDNANLTASTIALNTQTYGVLEIDAPAGGVKVMGGGFYAPSGAFDNSVSVGTGLKQTVIESDGTVSFYYNNPITGTTTPLEIGINTATNQGVVSGANVSIEANNTISLGTDYSQGNITLYGITSIRPAGGAQWNYSTNGFYAGNVKVIDNSGNWVGPAITDNPQEKIDGIYTNEQIQLDSFDSELYDTAKYFIKIKDGSFIHVVEIILAYDGTDILKSEYGVIINNVALGTFQADVAGGNVRLLFTPTDADNLSIRIEKTLMAV